MACAGAGGRYVSSPIPPQLRAGAPSLGNFCFLFINRHFAFCGFVYANSPNFYFESPGKWTRNSCCGFWFTVTGREWRGLLLNFKKTRLGEDSPPRSLRSTLDAPFRRPPRLSSDSARWVTCNPFCGRKGEGLHTHPLAESETQRDRTRSVAVSDPEGLEIGIGSLRSERPRRL